MRLIKWLSLGTIALLILVGAGGAILINQVDLSAYKKEIAEEVEAMTGRKLVIRGKIEKHLLTLNPALVLNDVSFSNARWSNRPQMVRAKKIRLVVRLLPLITGKIDIKRLDLVGADIVLETNKQEVGNWVLGADTPGSGASQPKKKAAGQPGAFGLNPDDVPFIEKIRIVDSRFTYIDGRTGFVSVVGLKDLRFDADGRSSPGTLTISGDVNGRAVKTTAATGSFRDFMAVSRQFPVKLKIVYGTTDIAGDLNIDFSGKRPRVTGTITSASLSLDELGTVGQSANASKPSSRAAAKPSRFIFGPDPLPLGLLLAFDADLTVQVGKLIVGRNPLTKVSARARLAGGRLAVTEFSAGAHGGQVKGGLNLNANTSVPSFALRLQVERVPLRQVTQLLFDRVLVASALNATINLTGSGRSPREMAAGMNGDVLAKLGSGPIDSSLLGLLSTDILSFLNKSGGGRLAISYGVIRSRFSKGVGQTSLVIDTTRLTFCGGGVVNMRNEAMSLLIQSEPKGVSVTSVAGLVPIRVAGPITRPGVSADTASIPKQTGKALFGIARRALGGRGGVCSVGGKRGSSGGSGSPSNILRKLNPFKR